MWFMLNRAQSRYNFPSHFLKLVGQDNSTMVMRRTLMMNRPIRTNCSFFLILKTTNE